MSIKNGIFDDGPTRDTVSDVYTSLLKNRKIWLVGEIDEASCFQIITEIQSLNQVDRESPIHLYINSPGGCVYSGCGVIDMIEHSDAPIYTYCFGHAMSMAAHILAAGEYGHRYITFHSTVMIHQVSSSGFGKTEDMEVSVEEMKRIEDRLHKTFSKHTGATASRLKKDMKADFYLSPENALKYGRKGIVDHIIK